MTPVPTSPALVAALLALGGAGVVDRVEGDRVVVEWTPAALGAAPVEQAAAVAVRWLELPAAALPPDTREGCHLSLQGGVLVAVPPPPPRPGPAPVALPRVLDLTRPLPSPGGVLPPPPGPGPTRATPLVPAHPAEGATP